MLRLTHPFAFVVNTTATKRSLIILLAWLWLFSPLIWMWPTARSLTDVLLSALLLLSVLLSRIATRIAVIALWLIGMCFLGYFYAVHSAPDEFFWLTILNSNPQESAEFIQSYRWLDAACMVAWALPALFAAALLWKSAPPLLASKKLRILAWSTLVLWLVWLSVSIYKNYGFYSMINRVNRVYPFMIVNSWERYERHAELALLKSDATAPSKAPMVDILVVVLGESSSAHRWSMLGYRGNPTNAALDEWKSSLISMPLTTNGNNTGKTLPVIITGRSLTPLPTTALSSYIDFAKAAGFRNEVFANQQAPGFANVALRLRSDNFLQLQDGRFDGELTPLFEQSITKSIQQSTPLVVTLHVNGSHPRVAKRTPAESAHWSDPYDNSIHYTSQLLSQWIKQISTIQGKRTALIYVSDHGQDFPVCGGSYIHGITRSTYEVPFLLWANNALRQEYPSWWLEWQGVTKQAVDAAGVPNYTTLLPMQAMQQLMGYEVVLPAPSVETKKGVYPPSEDRSLCSDWFSEVKKLHPAAVR